MRQEHFPAPSALGSAIRYARHIKNRLTFTDRNQTEYRNKLALFT